MAILVISSSLNPESRSRVLAKAAYATLSAKGGAGGATYVDIAELKLPMCDGAGAYGHPAVGPLAAQIADSSGVLLAFSTYNYDAGASCKNLIELTGKAWTGKVVALAAAAGGANAYMAPMQIASSLMLDFRCIVLPRYVYAPGAVVTPTAIADADVARRLEEMCGELVRVSTALGGK